MPNWSGGLLTTRGQALQAKVDAGICKLTLTKMKIGSGTPATGQDLKALTDLIVPESVIPISAVSASGNVTTVTGVITNAGLATGFSVRELGLFATDPDLGEILYSITIDSAPDYLPAEGGAVVVTEEFNYHIVVSNSANVEAIINPSGIVTVSVLDERINKHNTATDAHADLYHLRKNSTAYVVGDCKRSPTLPSWLRLECVVAGTTAATEPAWGRTAGVLVIDGTVKWIIDDIRDGTPVGRMVGDLVLRPGHIKANGATLQRSAYPRLVKFAKDNNLFTSDTTTYPGLFGVGDGSTTFVVPDWRAEITRFLDDGRGVDSGRALGSAQLDALQNITGVISFRAGAAGTFTGTVQGGTGPFSTGANTGSSANTITRDSGSTALADVVTFNASAVARTSTETRPRNISLLAQIKY